MRDFRSLLGCAVFVILFAASPSAGWAAAKASPEKELDFVQGVVLGPEFGGDGLIVSRWKSSPTLSIFGGSAEDHQQIENIVGQLNMLTKSSGVQIKIVKPKTENASFKVFLVPKDDFYGIAAKYRFTYTEHNDGFFNIHWNGWHQIDRAIVMIRDETSGKKRRHFMFEEITQAMGLANDSPLYKDSVFFAKGRNGGSAQDYSPLDRKLIRFTYQYLSPGDKTEDVVEAFNRYWASMSDE